MYKCVVVWRWWNMLGIIASVFLITAVFILSHSAWDYTKLLQKYIEAWDNHKRGEFRK